MLPTSVKVLLKSLLTSCLDPLSRDAGRGALTKGGMPAEEPCKARRQPKQKARL